MSWVADLWDGGWDLIKAPPWSQIALGLAVITSIPALTGFVYWAAAQRRRPEIEFLWKLSTSSRSEDLHPWDGGQVPELPPGSELLIETSVKNVGDAATTSAMTNLVMPVEIEFEKATGEGRGRVPTQVGGQQIAFIPVSFDLPPGTWQLQRYMLTVPEDPIDARVVFKLSDQGLNASGWRWLPSRLVGADQADETSYGEPWPPKSPRVRHQWTRVRARPHGRVWCARGERADSRDLRVVLPRAATPINDTEP